MDQFEFFMGFYGLLLGLSVAELLLGFGNLVRAPETAPLGCSNAVRWPVDFRAASREL